MKESSRVVEMFHEGEVATQKMSKELKEISDAAKLLLGGHLTERAVVILVWDSLPARGRPSKETVREVLRAAAQLDQYLVKKEE